MSGSFLENQYDRSDKPFELGPLAKKIKALSLEKIKTTAQKIVNDISKVGVSVPVAAPLSQAMMNQMNSHYYSQPQLEQFVATNADVAETLALLSYEDISDIVDRAYQLKSMKTSELNGSTSSHGPG